MYRCPSCAGWLCPRGTLDTLARLELQLQREAAFASFSPEERAAMAREIAAETAEAAPIPSCPWCTGCWRGSRLPVVTRIRRERIPAVTWSLALVLVAVFVLELRGDGLEAAVARLGYGPAHRGLWAAGRAMFAHAGWWHLLGNVYFLLAFGDGVEQRAPRWLLPPAFVVAARRRCVADGALHPTSVMVGASGGVAAVLGACVVLQPRAQVAIHLWPLSLRLSMRGFFVLYLLFQLVMGAAHLPGTAWTAQLVGLALGAPAVRRCCAGVAGHLDLALFGVPAGRAGASCGPKARPPVASRDWRARCAVFSQVTVRTPARLRAPTRRTRARALRIR